MDGVGSTAALLSSALRARRSLDQLGHTSRFTVAGSPRRRSCSPHPRAAEVRRRVVIADRRPTCGERSTTMHRKSLSVALALAIGWIASLVLVLVPVPAGASSHSEAPGTSKDRLIDDTDLYAFVAQRRTRRRHDRGELGAADRAEQRSQLRELRRRRPLLRQRGQRRRRAQAPALRVHASTPRGRIANTFLYNTGPVVEPRPIPTSTCARPGRSPASTSAPRRRDRTLLGTGPVAPCVRGPGVDARTTGTLAQSADRTTLPGGYEGVRRARATIRSSSTWRRSFDLLTHPPAFPATRARAWTASAATTS